LIDQVGEKNPIVAEKLLTLVKQYDYENLNRVLER